MSNCRPINSCSIFAGQANGNCQIFNADNFQGEQLIFNNSMSELINNFGTNVNYYVNTYNVSATDNFYGEDPTRAYSNPQRIRMYVQVSDNAITLRKFGFVSEEEFTGFVHIDTFTTLFSSLSYNTFGQRVEPKSGDVIELVDYYCRPGDRGPRMYEITERVDEDIPSINPLYGSYVYRLKGKRFEYSFEPGLTGESGNNQVYDNTFSGILTSVTDYNTLSLDDSTSVLYLDGDFELVLAEFQVQPNAKSYPGDVDELSIEQVFNQNVNNTDIYGLYG
jgi:hypothetical protein